jgi:hypothetical protein
MSQDIKTKEIYDCEGCRDRKELKRLKEFWEQSAKDWKEGYERLQSELIKSHDEERGA